METYYYLTASGRDPYQEWVDKLKDHTGRTVILPQVDRVTAGNFGEHRSLQEGVWKLKIDVGPGYRVYYALERTTIVMLLCGGSKRTREADIQRAVRYWNNYQRRRET